MSKTYKHCIVPLCHNTTVKTPMKTFVAVPKIASVRNKWCEAMNRDPNIHGALSAITSRHVCEGEDHFILEEDMENYTEFKQIPATRIKMKPGVLPHIFECQRDMHRARPSVIVRPAQNPLKRTHSEPDRTTKTYLERMNQILSAYRTIEPVPSTSSASAEENAWEIATGYHDALYLATPEPPLPMVPHTFVEPATLTSSSKHLELVVASQEHTVIGSKEKHKETADVASQVFMKPYFRSKGTNTALSTKNVALSPIKNTRQTSDCSTSTSPLIKRGGVPRQAIEFQSEGSSTSTATDTDEFIPTCLNSSDSVAEEYEFQQMQYKIKEGMLLAIQLEPKMYLGIPKHSYGIIAILASLIPTNVESILLTVKKIKLNESLEILGHQFGMSTSNASIVFRKTLCMAAQHLQELIVWPSSKDIEKLLPIPFRARYSKVQSIIDCFEIQIEKPSNSTHQSLTWSEYYGCNTIKYLISCTPDGLVNFVSDGYSGRATDDMIIADSKYLDRLKPGTVIMADRGFKNSALLLELHKCVIVRPPSVFSKTKSTREEVMLSKRIAALRIHVERVIGRIREFKMLTPHSCIDNHLVQHLDYMVIVACGIINIQGQ